MVELDIEEGSCASGKNQHEVMLGKSISHHDCHSAWLRDMGQEQMELQGECYRLIDCR